MSKVYKTYKELKTDVRKILSIPSERNMEYSFSYSVRFRTNRLHIRFQELTVENVQLISDICELGFIVYQTLGNDVKETNGKFHFDLSAKYF